MTIAVKRWPYLQTSEPDRNIGLETVLCRATSELTLIGEAEGCGIGQVQIEAGLNEGGVRGDRHAGDVEGAAAGKDVGGDRRRVAEGMTPAERAVGRRLHASKIEGGG